MMVSQSSHDIDYSFAREDQAMLISSMYVLHFSQNTTLKGQCIGIVLINSFHNSKSNFHFIGTTQCYKLVHLYGFTNLQRPQEVKGKVNESKMK